MKRITPLIAGVLIFGSFWLSAARAQSGPDYFELAYLAEIAPLEALDGIEVALQKTDPSTAQLRYDLLRLKAETYLKLKLYFEAAETVAELASIAEVNPQLDRDPIPLWNEAADLYATANRGQSAVEMMKRMVAAMELRGYEKSLVQSAEIKLTEYAAVQGIELGEVGNGVGQPMIFAPMARRGMPTASIDSIENGFREVDVYYATDRARNDESMPATFYGSGRGDLELGIARVTIPDNHTPGMLEAPSIWRLEFSANPARHVVLQSVTPLEHANFFARLNKEFETGMKKEAFVFIHGYNVLFDQAAKRAAQIAYDMDFQGVPILYSWPSRGSTIGYVADSAVVRLSGRRLARFLEDVRFKSGASTIHIVAHSMGNRALTDALEIMALKNGISEGSDPLFGQVVFAAPDVDSGLFLAMMQTIRPIARRLTLYTSDKDWALEASRRLHGSAPRAGQGGAEALADATVDSIDMTELGNDMLAHSYFAGDSSALADMVSLFWRNADPDRRCGLVAENHDADITIWRYAPQSCTTRGLIDAVAHLRAANVGSMHEARQVLNEKVFDTALLDELLQTLEKLLE